MNYVHHSHHHLFYKKAVVASICAFSCALTLACTQGNANLSFASLASGARVAFAAPSRHYDVPFELKDMSFSDQMTYFTKWESGRNYNHGFGAGDGYNALGAYQFDRRYGLATFMQQVVNYDPATFHMLAEVGEKYNWDFETPVVWDAEAGKFTDFGNDLNAAWHAAYNASPTLFSHLQDYYCYRNYYSGPDGVYRSLRYFGFDLDGRSDSVKSLAWGMANLFGKGGGAPELKRGHVWGANKFFAAAGVNGNMSDAEFVRAVCTQSIDHVKEVLPKSGAYWEGYINRYTDEEREYLSHLKLPAGQVNRVYNPSTGEHLFITEKSDLDWYTARGWTDEGAAWFAPLQSNEVVYRLCNPYSGDHMFTKDPAEVETMKSNGWVVQSTPFSSASSDQRPVYRLFNPYATFATHHFTLFKDERDNLKRIGWIVEGVAWYGNTQKSAQK